MASLTTIKQHLIISLKKVSEKNIHIISLKKDSFQFHTHIIFCPIITQCGNQKVKLKTKRARVMFDLAIELK